MLINTTKKKIFILIAFGLITWFAFCLQSPLINDPQCTVLFDSKGNLLSAKIATDGQWRFQEVDSIPYKIKKSIITFEDKYFYYHPGINPFSIVRAIRQNIKAVKIISGGSTITSQLIRLSRKGKSRTIYEKIIESILAFRAEIRYSKEEILKLYISNAPFGGNVVGIDAASWRYFGRPADRLSWGEAATLAVLPNAPALIYPGRNQDDLLLKRNRLLNYLLESGEIDSLTCDLAKMEPLPGSPKILPQFTPHLLDRSIKEGHEGERITTTINSDLQDLTSDILQSHYNTLVQNEIHNAAAIIIEVETGSVLAYVGNTNSQAEESGKDVDIITSRRSTGSILKPFLYALMQKEGEILPATLIPDIPTQIGGYSPQNFNKRFEGAAHAGNALARSLNVPAVRMLRMYGIDRFQHNLNQLGISTITKPSSHYGLSLILGGAEATLWELTGVYAGMARTLENYIRYDSKYLKGDYNMPHYITRNDTLSCMDFTDEDVFFAGAVWLTFEALSEMDRPEEGANWSMYSASKKIAWKTGTSFGHKDAWAIGITPGYVVGVWVGNADGEGRPGLTGASAAAPVMFDIYKLLPYTGWFEIPHDDLIELEVCNKSGYKASMVCDKIDTILTTKTGVRTELCPYHQNIQVDSTKRYRVSGNCYKVSDMITEPWFILPPVIEWYYKSKDPSYRMLLPYHPNCNGAISENMDIIYPREISKMFIPKNFGSKTEKIVFEVVHRLQGTEIYWHIDKKYLGSTKNIHEMEVYANEGIHTLTLIDEYGEELTRTFEIIGR